MKTSFVAVIAAAALGAGCTMMDSKPAEPKPMAAPKAMTMAYTATLAPAAGVTSSGKGMGAFTYDPATHTLTYNVTYSDLSGPALAAHIHGPADPGASGPPVVPFANPASPISGTATLTDAQAADLAAGKYYVNVHTAANKGGEIRGQIVKK
ncbi:MAG TPA: CHRD domain-containing protein [Hyphomonadaceae bacterium]|nr:CHRD domain-containing protein [Hyphomonadaceae bacterium]